MSETPLIICRSDELGGKIACWPVGHARPQNDPSKQLTDHGWRSDALHPFTLATGQPR
jgi:hypothetical protein